MNLRPPGYEAISSTNRSHFGSDLCFLPPFVRRIFRCFRPALPAFFGFWVKSGSDTVRPHPRQQRLVVHRTGGDSKPDLDDLVVGAVQPNTVDLQKGQHHIHTDALIAIHKGMVGDERIAQPSALFLLGRVEFLPAKAGKDILQRGLQQSLIPDADAPACLLRDEPVKQQDLRF